MTHAEIEFFIKGCIDGSIPDYQTTALLMAIYFKGMENEETATLTRYMARSGELIDLSEIQGIKVDKHSTGGVGDKTTLVVAPIVAACGVKIAKMSGRGLGHTGGTLDKLESIPGFQISIEHSRFVEIVNEIGLSVIGQTGNIAPADKKLYALRDVTATVESKPLIAASIMSKKIASGADCILLDVKTGSGAFMKNVKDAIELAEIMVSIGENVKRRTAAMITNMNIPLGNAIGNSLEVIEAVNTLSGKGPKDLMELCVYLAAEMIQMAGEGSKEDCIMQAENAIKNGTALEKLEQMVSAQGGDASFISDTSKFEKAQYHKEVKAHRSGYLYNMDTEKCGIASMLLGAGRETKDSIIDYTAGIILNKKTGDIIKKGDVIADFYTSDKNKMDAAEDLFLSAVDIWKEEPPFQPILFARVDKNGVEKLGKAAVERLWQENPSS